MTPEDRARAADEAEEKRQRRIAFNRILHVITHWERPQQRIIDVYYISRETLRRFPELEGRWSEFKLAQFILPNLVSLKRASFEMFNEEWIKATKPTKLAGNGGVVYLHGKPIEEYEFRKRHGITLITKDYFCEKNVEGTRTTLTEEIITYKPPYSVDYALEFTPGRGRGFKVYGVCLSYLFGKGQPNYFDQAADITTSGKGGGMVDRALNRTLYNNENEHASDTETDNIVRHAENLSYMDAINHREELAKKRAEREEEARRKFEAENLFSEEEGTEK